MPQQMIDQLVTLLGDVLRARGWRLVTAESCTGGLIAGACTAVAGSSDWFDRGFVTYSNEAKQDMLGVSRDLIREQGAVSEPVARAMATGALNHSTAQIAVAVTGVAGPGGGTPAKPVGLVWLAWAQRAPGAAAATVEATCLQFAGDRTQVRQGTVLAALHGLAERARIARGTP